MSVCRDCGSPIRWRQTPRGKWQPLDADGTPHQATCAARPRPQHPEDVCLRCGSVHVVTTPGAGVHQRALRCQDCGAHRWLPQQQPEPAA